MANFSLGTFFKCFLQGPFKTNTLTVFPGGPKRPKTGNPKMTTSTVTARGKGHPHAEGRRKRVKIIKD